MSNIDDPEWAGNPCLNHWLHTQAAAVHGWAETTEPQPGPGAYVRTEPVVTLPKEVLEDWELEELQEKEELYEDDFPCCTPSEAVVSAARPEYTGHLFSFLHQYAHWRTAVDRALARARDQPSQSPESHPLPDAPGLLDPGPVGESLAEWPAGTSARRSAAPSRRVGCLCARAWTSLSTGLACSPWPASAGALDRAQS